MGGWDRVGRSSSLHALGRTVPRRESKVLSDLGERDRQCTNTLGGSDTTYPAAGSS